MTTKRMTAEDLAVIEARANAATSAPWRACGGGGCQCGHVWSTPCDVIVSQPCRDEEIDAMPSEEMARLFAAAPALRRTVIELHARVAELTRERDEAHAIIEGRATPPTDEEIAVHQAHGGEWLGFRADGPPWRRGAVIADFTYSEEHVRAAHRCARWWAIDAEGRPCAWPVTQ